MLYFYAADSFGYILNVFISVLLLMNTLVREDSRGKRISMHLFKKKKKLTVGMIISYYTDVSKLRLKERK